MFNSISPKKNKEIQYSYEKLTQQKDSFREEQEKQGKRKQFQHHEYISKESPRKKDEIGSIMMKSAKERGKINFKSKLPH